MALTFVLPLTVNRWGYDFSVLPKAALLQIAAAAIALLTALSLRRRQRRVGGLWVWRRAQADLPNPLILPVTVWLALAGLSTVLGLHPGTSILGASFRVEGLLSLVAYGLLIWAVPHHINTRGRLLTMVGALLGATAIVGVHGIAQHFGLDFVSWQGGIGRSFATFGNPIYLGAFLGFGIPLSFALAMSAADRRRRLAYGCVFVLTGAALAFTYGRAAWVAALVSLVALCAMNAGAVGARVKRVAALVAVAAVVVGAMYVVYSPALYSVSERATSAFDPGDPSVRSRLVLWSASLGAVRDRPVLGWGPDTFGLVFPRYKPRSWAVVGEQAIASWFAHNDVIQTASTVGVLGLGAYLWVLAAFFAWSAAALKRLKEEARKADGLVLSALVLAAAGYVLQIQASASLPQTSPFLWLLVGGAVGVWGGKAPGIEARGHMPPDVPAASTLSTLRAWMDWKVAAALAALLAALWLNGHLIAADVFFWKGERAREKRDWAAATHNYDLAASLDSSFERRAAAGKAYLFEAMDTGDTRWLQRALPQLDLAEKSNPFAPQPYLSEGDLYLWWGRRGRGRANDSKLALAIANYRRVVEMDPNWIEGRFWLGKALEAAGRDEEAAAQWRRVVAMNPRAPDGYQELRRVYIKLGRDDLAAEVEGKIQAVTK